MAGFFIYLKFMTAKTYSAALIGISAVPVEVEVDLSQGLHSFNIVGLPSKTIEESKDRVSSAVKNSGASPPQKSNRRIIVNLAPADLKKQGSLYDLPIAVSYLIASGQVKSFNLDKTLFLGELALSGEIKRIPGVLPIALMAKERGFNNLITSKYNALEATIVEGLNVFGLDNLRQLIKFLENKISLKSEQRIDLSELIKQNVSFDNFSDIKGQYQAKRALIIAAAGSHNILMKGSPGSGKSMLAKALPSILPIMSADEALEAAKIYSVCGLLSLDNKIILSRPFRSPHHTASAVSLVGGGSWPRPGEVSLAHRGVLFLDEMGEFSKTVLEALRQPLEDGVVSVTRAQGRVVFPARFILVAAMNPCPCGFLGDSEKECCCSRADILRYKKRISGPLLDRIDIQIEVPRVKYEELKSVPDKEYCKQANRQIDLARKAQTKRFANFRRKIFFNSEMNSSETIKVCSLDFQAEEMMKKAVDGWHLSARAHYKTLKLARTIADLEGEENISTSHLAEALSYRIRQED